MLSTEWVKALAFLFDLIWWTITMVTTTIERDMDDKDASHRPAQIWLLRLNLVLRDAQKAADALMAVEESGALSMIAGATFREDRSPQGGLATAIQMCLTKDKAQ